MHATLGVMVAVIHGEFGPSVFTALATAYPRRRRVALADHARRFVLTAYTGRRRQFPTESLLQWSIQDVA